ncbi:MAG: hypothetical protein Q9177_002787 [Variospora cf. flavescens]
MASNDSPAYQPKDAVGGAARSTLILGGAGLFLSAVQNSLTRQNVTGWGVITRTGGTIGLFAAIGGTFEFARVAAANLREKDDAYNQAIGGFFAGGIVGFRMRSFPAVIGYGAALATLQGVFEYTGGKLNGYEADSSVDQYERKEQLRRNRRRPIEETLQELGEGRGIYGPGYDERRRERIQKRYGVDVAQNTLRGLKKQFEDVRSEVVPKRKFAFKPKPKPVPSDHSLQLSEPDSSVVSSSQPISNPSDHLCHESMTGNGGAGSLEHVSVLSNVHHTLRTESHHEYVDRGIVIANSSHCVIKCLVPSPSLAINEVRSSVIVCGPINGAALVTGMTASTLVISCQQLRLHRCGSCILYLRCSSRPIIEDCCGMQFAPFPESLVGGHFPLVSYLTEAVKNLPPLGVAMSESWAQVDDFGWLKAGHSPNWNILAPEDRRSADHWKRLLNATDGAVGDILQAFETTGCMTTVAPKDEPL